MGDGQDGLLWLNRIASQAVGSVIERVSIQYPESSEAPVLCPSKGITGKSGFGFSISKQLVTFWADLGLFLSLHFFPLP